MGRLGITEILLILGVALLLFGGTRIGEIGKGLGEGIKNFKKGIRDDEEPPKLAKKADDDEPAKLPPKVKSADEAEADKKSA